MKSENRTSDSYATSSHYVSKETNKSHAIQGAIEINVLIAEGMSNMGIAQRLDLLTYAVKSHIHDVLEKMALLSRLEIATHSYEN